MKTAPRPEAEQVWRQLVALVMETRGAWRRQVTESTGLSFGRVRALKRLQGEPRTLRDLAQEMGIDAPAVTVLVDDLESRGLARRQAHPENRRSKLVCLTDKGRRMLATLQQLDDPPPPGFAALSPAQLALLQRALGPVDRDDPGPGPGRPAAPSGRR